MRRPSWDCLSSAAAVTTTNLIPYRSAISTACRHSSRTSTNTGCTRISPKRRRRLHSCCMKDQAVRHQQLLNSVREKEAELTRVSIEAKQRFIENVSDGPPIAEAAAKFSFEDVQAA